MGNKVILIHEDNVFKIYINGKVVEAGTDMDEIVEKFKVIFRDNTPAGSYVSWEDIYNRVSRFKDFNIEINTEYKTIEYKKMKYFFGTNKIFYIDDTMAPLLGGYELFDFIMRLLQEGLVEDYENVLVFCKDMMESEILYRIFDTNIVVSSPGFNYGSIGYDFSTNKISKGTAIIKGSFEDFCSYVKENLA